MKHTLNSEAKPQFHFQKELHSDRGSVYVFDFISLQAQLRVETSDQRSSP